ncbi:MAG: hypothetical protein Tsb009_19090 [Planctomycetaceae bacterium]
MLPADLLEHYESFSQLASEFGGHENEWLSAIEREERLHWRNSSRQMMWTWGRIVSKRLILKAMPESHEIDPRDISICSRDNRGRGISPRVSVQGTPWNGCLSISHTNRAVYVAWLPGMAQGIGVDLVDQQSGSFTSQSMKPWFTIEEQQQLPSGDRFSSLRYWAAKEAAFKACSHPGMRFVPRKICLLETSATDFSAECQHNLERQSCRVVLREQDEHFLAIALTESLLTRQQDRSLELRLQATV